MLARTHLIQLQKALYEKLKGHARHYVGGLRPDLKHYFRDYQDSLRSYEGLTSHRQLLIDLIKSQVVFCGDYHTLAQSQRTFLRLLKSTHKVLKRQKRTVILALEMFEPKHQKHLNAYLAGKLSERALLERTQFRTRWGFQWENYVPLLRFAKDNSLGLLGVDPGKKLSIKERDRFAAHRLATLSYEDPSAVIFVLIGDLHLAENHLPKEFENQLKRKKVERQWTVIHQNNERFYWSLVEQGLESFVEVIKVKDRVYCVMNTPPWVKLQSHLKWVEALAEGAGPRGYARDYARAIDSLDHSDEVVEALRILKSFFELQDFMEEDFNIRGPLDLSFLDRLEKEHVFTQRQIKILTTYLSEFDSQFFPRSNDLFLTNLSLNHLMVQSAYFLHSRLSGFQGVFENPRRDFYTFVWIEALAFLSSKLINPKRKMLSELELRRRFRNARRGKDSKAIQFALLHIEKERRMSRKGEEDLSFPRLKEKDSVESVLLFYKAAKILGGLLGGALHSALYEGRVSKDEIREYFYCPFTPEHKPKKLYLNWVKRLDEYQYRDILER